jgi:hypothetical protein
MTMAAENDMSDLFNYDGEPVAKTDYVGVMLAICRQSLAEAVTRGRQRDAELADAKTRHPSGGQAA